MRGIDISAITPSGIDPGDTRPIEHYLRTLALAENSRPQGINLSATVSAMQEEVRRAADKQRPQAQSVHNSPTLLQRSA